MEEILNLCFIKKKYSKKTKVCLYHFSVITYFFSGIQTTEKSVADLQSNV